MGRSLATVPAATALSSGRSITPPAISTNDQVIGGIYSSDAALVPMVITNAGEHARLPSSADPFVHYDNAGATIWSVDPTSVIAGYQWCGMYWDKVDNRLYMWIIDTATKTQVQMLWLNTLTGAATLLGAAHTVLAAFGAAMLFTTGTERIGGQGVGNFRITVADYNGMGDIEFTAAGALVATTLNILLHPAGHKVSARHRVDATHYLGAITSVRTVTISGGTTNFNAPQIPAITFATDKYSKQIIPMYNHGGVIMGAHYSASSIGYPIAAEAIDWGGDIAIVYPFSLADYVRRDGVTLYDAVDFKRWALEQIAACGG